ncbi:unnamed protein product [Adineta steineri]|uniref:G-protein coupled receptors family 1 profile domain-containing protein n=1 Tax=Adineta steineri TaxID=433720 RepID=A0A815PDB6_9BILA|nr:unnamed protein product [Adineta steineri]
MDNTIMNSTPTESEDDDTWANDKWMVPYLFLLLIIGTIGNSFGILLFQNSAMRKYSCSLYFLLMAIFDELTLFCWVVNRLFGELSYTSFSNRSTILCKLFVVVYYSSSQAAVGMLVLAMFDRLYTTFKIAHGYFDVRVLTRRQHFQYICLGVFFSILTAMNSLLFGSQLFLSPEDDTEYCLIIDPDITQIYSIIDLCIYAIVPCICMLIGDILILYYIQKARARVITINSSSKRREKQLSIMLVITSMISLFIVSPYSFLKLLINFSIILDTNIRTLYTLNDAFGLLSTCTHAMHFYLFLIISSTIRKHFKSLLQSLVTNCSNARNIIQPVVIAPIKTTMSSQPTVHIIQRTPCQQSIR